MASFEAFYPRLKKWEGGYATLANDSGGCTNHGIAFNYNRNLFKDYNNDGAIDCEDVRLMPSSDAKNISKAVFWDKFLADSIKNQEIAEILVDWGFNSGPGIPTMEVQKMLGLAPDGAFGIATLAALNKANSKQLYEKIFQAREDFYRRIGVGSQAGFLQGWLNRLYDFPKTISGASIPTKKKLIFLVLFLIALGVLSYIYRREILDFYKKVINKLKQ